MSDDHFEPDLIPINSQVLVATLKRRLQEAIDTGKASDAKAFVDIIDRLANMAWLDETTSEEKLKLDSAQRQRVMADVDVRLARYLSVQSEEEGPKNQSL